jgi:hypothetical protein
MASEYTHRNGETQPPELAENEFSHYWFDGVAHYEDWTKRGELIVVTGKGADRVVGLVIVAKMIDMKRPVRLDTGQFVRNHSTMIAEPETAGYDLDKCEGKWWGPVSIPKLSDDLIPSTAAVTDYKEWLKFYPEQAQPQE